MAFMIPIVEALVEIVEATEAAAAAVGETTINAVTAIGNAMPDAGLDGAYAATDTSNLTASTAAKMEMGTVVAETGLGLTAGSAAIYATAAKNPHGNVQATGSGDIPATVSTVDNGKSVVYDPANPTPTNPNVYNPVNGKSGSTLNVGSDTPRNYCPDCELNKDLFSVPWGNVPSSNRFLRRRKKKKKSRIYAM